MGPQRFQSTLPAGEATHRPRRRQQWPPISIHASRGGSDGRRWAADDRAGHFNPRFPRGKRPENIGPLWAKSNFNPRFPRGKRQVCRRKKPGGFIISIHASRGGSDDKEAIMIDRYLRFQSTLPAGEATRMGKEVADRRVISIHASRGGSDRVLDSLAECKQVFQSTLPAGEATRYRCGARSHPEVISIHASRGGSDYPYPTLPIPTMHFNPRFPRGKRPIRADQYRPLPHYFNPRFPRGKRRRSTPTSR